MDLKTPAYRQALNVAWYRVGRCGYDFLLKGGVGWV